MWANSDNEGQPVDILSDGTFNHNVFNSGFAKAYETKKTQIKYPTLLNTSSLYKSKDRVVSIGQYICVKPFGGWRPL